MNHRQTCLPRPLQNLCSARQQIGLVLRVDIDDRSLQVHAEHCAPTEVGNRGRHYSVSPRFLPLWPNARQPFVDAANLLSETFLCSARMQTIPMSRAIVAALTSKGAKPVGALA